MTKSYSNPRMRPELLALLETLRPGQRLRITQTVRVGMKVWPASVVGTFRHVDSLATGLATERRAADGILVPIIHFTKDNGELSSVAIDEQTQVELADASTAPEPMGAELKDYPENRQSPLANPQ